MEAQVGTFELKKGLAQMLKGGVIMDVVTPGLCWVKSAACRTCPTKRLWPMQRKSVPPMKSS